MPHGWMHGKEHEEICPHHSLCKDDPYVVIFSNMALLEKIFSTTDEKNQNMNWNL